LGRVGGEEVERRWRVVTRRWRGGGEGGGGDEEGGLEVEVERRWRGEAVQRR